MFQVRIHGRGGQGAPAMAFCRLDERDIRLGEPVVGPDALIIQDSTLLQQVNLFKGLDRRGYLLDRPRQPSSGLTQVNTSNQCNT